MYPQDLYEMINMPFPNSAEAVGRRGKLIEEMQKRAEIEENAKTQKIMNLIQETKKQNELLEKQIQAMLEHNKHLLSQCESLQNLYETAKEEAQANATTAQKSAEEARRSKIFSCVTFGITTSISIISIIVGVLIGLFL